MVSDSFTARQIPTGAGPDGLTRWGAVAAMLTHGEDWKNVCRDEEVCCPAGPGRRTAHLSLGNAESETNKTRHGNWAPETATRNSAFGAEFETQRLGPAS
jgi:hypothetical protein